LQLDQKVVAKDEASKKDMKKVEDSPKDGGSGQVVAKCMSTQSVKDDEIVFSPQDDQFA